MSWDKSAIPNVDEGARTSCGLLRPGTRRAQGIATSASLFWCSRVLLRTSQGGGGLEVVRTRAHRLYQESTGLDDLVDTS